MVEHVCITQLIAKDFCTDKKVDRAIIHQVDGKFIVYVKSSKTNYVVAIASARKPYEPRLFMSLDGAMSALVGIGLKKARIKME